MTDEAQLAHISESTQNAFEIKRDPTGDDIQTSSKGNSTDNNNQKQQLLDFQADLNNKEISIHSEITSVTYNTDDVIVPGANISQKYDRENDDSSRDTNSEGASVANTTGENDSIEVILNQLSPYTFQEYDYSVDAGQNYISCDRDDIQKYTESIVSKMEYVGSDDLSLKHRQECAFNADQFRWTSNGQLQASVFEFSQEDAVIGATNALSLQDLNPYAHDGIYGNESSYTYPNPYCTDTYLESYVVQDSNGEIIVINVPTSQNAKENQVQAEYMPGHYYIPNLSLESHVAETVPFHNYTELFPSINLYPPTQEAYGHNTETYVQFPQLANPYLETLQINPVYPYFDRPFPTDSHYINSKLQGVDQSMQYPILFVSEAGVLTALLNHGISVEMTKDRAIRLVCHDQRLVVATNCRGSSSCIFHPAAKIIQESTTTNVDLFLARKASMTTEFLTFGNNYKTYKFDYKIIEETVSDFQDISSDVSVNYLYCAEGYGPTAVQECIKIIYNAQYQPFKEGGFAIFINGVKITQNARGDVSVISAPKFLRLSPIDSVIRVNTHFVQMNVEANWSVKVRRGSHTLNASHLGFVVSNGKIEAAFDEINRLRAFSLPMRIPMYVGPKKSRRPGAAARRLCRSPVRRENDHAGYTLRATMD